MHREQKTVTLQDGLDELSWSGHIHQSSASSMGRCYFSKLTPPYASLLLAHHKFVMPHILHDSA